MHKRFQRIVTFVLALILAAGFLSMVAMTVSAASVFSGTIDFSEFFRPIIERQPKSVTATEGHTVEISVVAKKRNDMDTLSYQWYYQDKGENSFTEASGCTNAVYSVTATAAMDGRQVYCKVSSKYGVHVQTDTATITVQKALRITKQPASVNAGNGEKFTVSVEATGEGLSYLWYYKDKGDSAFRKSSVKTATYSATMEASLDGRQIYCVVTDDYDNTVQSKTVTLAMASHTHSYAAAFTADSKGHWHVCADCGEKGSYASHDFENACDKDCSVCGYSRKITHTYGDNWNSSGSLHWQECTVCGAKTAKAEHTADAEQTCKICGAAVTASTQDTEPTTVPTQPTTAPTDPTAKVEGDTYEDMLSNEEDAFGKTLFWCVCAVVASAGIVLVVIMVVRRKKDEDEW